MFPKKYRIHAVLILVALVIIFLPSYNERPDSKMAAAATKAADKFLALVDADQFAQSWEACAPILKDRVPQQTWVDQLKKTRDVTGALVKRSEKSMTYSSTMEGSPDGDYILIQYDTGFQAKSDAHENLTVMRCKDGVWRVAGYFIQK